MSKGFYTFAAIAFWLAYWTIYNLSVATINSPAFARNSEGFQNFYLIFSAVVVLVFGLGAVAFNIIALVKWIRAGVRRLSPSQVVC